MDTTRTKIVKKILSNAGFRNKIAYFADKNIHFSIKNVLNANQIA